MIETVVLSNIRNQTNRTVKLGLRTSLCGKNGAGKTTIREALCFCFCGTDSLGTKNPQHLLREGADEMKIEVHTTRAVISRTLTKKGNSTLRVQRGDVSSTFTQSQFEGMMGSPDVVLSCLVPNFFMRLSAERQQKVLHEVIASEGRAKLLQDNFGIQIPAELALKYKLDRRADLLAADIAKDRRLVQQDIAVIGGQVQMLANRPVIPEPVQPPEIQTLPRLRILRDQWQQYNSKLLRYNDALQNRQWAEEENEKRNQQVLVAQKQLETLQLRVVPEPRTDLGEQYAALGRTLKPLPIAPAMQRTTDQELCPTCGQTVGSKHREKVHQENELLMKQHQEAVTAVETHNAGVKLEAEKISRQMDEHDQKRRQIEKENQKIQTTISQLRALVSAASGRVPLPELPEQAQIPEEHFHPEELQAAETAERDYLGARSAWEQQATEIRQRGQAILDMQNRQARLIPQVDWLQLLEKAILELPALEMRAKTQALCAPGELDVTVTDKVTCQYHGIPYELLSTGQELKTGILLCMKLDGLRGNKAMHVVFIDNADLLDEEGKSIQYGDGIQVLRAVVSEAQELEVVVE